MNRSRQRFLVAAGVLLLGVATVGFAGVVSAGHGSPANFTVYPSENADRNPSSTDATYVMSSAGADAFESDGLEIVDYYWIESDQANFADCDPDNARVFGIDRGNNNSGTQTDVDLLQHMKSNQVSESRIDLELYEEGDLGGDTINLNPPDATIAVLGDCIENTGQAGWYQFEGFVNGTTYGGEYEEIFLTSHYFWIGDFENEEEAREELGPPPSEADNDDAETDESTPTPTATPTPTPVEETDDDDAETDESTPTPTTTPDGDEAETDNEQEVDDDTQETERVSDDDGAGAADDGPMTPAAGDGPGFGPVAALLALLSASLLATRHR